MAVETTTTSASFTGTGVSSTYAPGFYVNSSDQVQVYVDGVLKTLGVDYVVNGVGASAGCTIVGTFAGGSAVYIERVTPITQLVDTQNNETILEDVLDAEFDKLTMIAQEAAGKLLRAMLVPKGEIAPALQSVSLRANKFAAFDSSGALIGAAVSPGVSATGTLVANSRVVLASLSIPSAGQNAWLSESGRSGMFEWRLGNYTALVAADPYQGIYVPSTIPGSGAAVGCWVRASNSPVNIKWFGAKGDGVSDDTASIQAAINYLQALATLSAEGATLYLPAGFYKLSAALTVSDQIVIRGEGAESTKLQTTSGYIFDVSSASVEFHDLFFVGPSIGPGNGVKLTNGNNCIIERCVFQNQTTGIDLISSYAVEVRGCIFDVCYTYGIYASTSAHNLLVEASGFFTCGVAGGGQAIRLAAASDNINIINADFEYCATNVDLQDCSSVQITGCYMEYHRDEALNFRGTCYGVIIESNWIALGLNTGGGDTLTLQNITGGRFRHNTIYNQEVTASAATLAGFTFGLNKKTGTGTYNPSTWATPTLLNSWAQQTNYTDVGYYKDENGWVWLRGALVSGTAPNTLFTLPAGYRPAKIMVFGTESASGACRITVNPDGTVVPTIAASNNACLDGIAFFVG